MLVRTVKAPQEDPDSYWLDTDRFPGIQHQSNHIFPEQDLATVVEQICIKGRRSIQVASELLGRRDSGGGDT